MRNKCGKATPETCKIDCDDCTHEIKMVIERGGVNEEIKMVIDDGGPAFPVVTNGHPNITVYSEGMTLRDYFAAKAMQTCISCLFPQTPMAHIVEMAYETADAMIKEKKNIKK